MCSAPMDGRSTVLRCTACDAIYCSACAQECVSQAPLHEHPTPEPDLLRGLRALPEAFPQQPVLWIPRRCKQAAAEILLKLIKDAILFGDAPPEDDRAEIAHRLLRACPQILFRPTDAEEEDDRGQHPSIAIAIRDRLHRAAQGEWTELVSDCLSDVTKQLRRSRGAPAAVDGEISDAMLQAASLKSRNGSDRGAAQILVGGPAVPPGAETDEKIKALFRTEPLVADELGELQEVIAASRRCSRRIYIGPAHASRSVARIRMAAGPGPSGFRNSYIAVIHTHPEGARVLGEWAAMWARAAVAPRIASLWTGALVRPFFKANGVDVRPILCAEALLKFAVGTTIRRLDRPLAEAMGDRQFGAGRSGGAALEVGQVRAAARLKPGNAFTSLDVQNAFGSVQWKDALQTVIRTMPKLAPILGIQWQSCELQLFLQDAGGNGWHKLTIYGSLLQRGLDGHPVFCLVIGVVLQHVSAHQAVRESWHLVVVWIYVDDMLFQCPIELVQQLMVAVEETLIKFSLKLQRAKCKIHVPALASTPLAEWPETAKTPWT